MKTKLALLFLLVLFTSCKTGEADKTTENMDIEISGSEQNALLESLNNYIFSSVLEFSTIDEKRKSLLNELAGYLSQRTRNDQPVSLMFICTHNSRRSHMSQLWAQVAAFYYHVPGVHCYSGGTEATALNPRAINALKNAGFEISVDSEGENPVYRVQYTEGVNSTKAFSKKFSDPFNPHDDFAAIMTCSYADEACPIVPGAEVRFFIPYQDPKAADNTPEEEARYAERCKQIANEMFYLFSNINK